MKIEFADDLLEARITITDKGKSKIINKLVIDIEATHTIISCDTVDG
jgi:hypothetical protein